MSAELDSVDIRLRGGLHGELLPGLTTRAREQPLDERVAGQLMLALYRGGRPADALNHYQSLRGRLAEELGIDPAPALQELYQQILVADPRLAAPQTGSTAGVVPRQLPAPPPLFTGRESELVRLNKLLTPQGEPDGESVLIAAVYGTGGVGKTWLALRWAHEQQDAFPDGQLYTDLRGFAPSGEPRTPTRSCGASSNPLAPIPRPFPPPRRPRPRCTAASPRGGGGPGHQPPPAPRPHRLPRRRAAHPGHARRRGLARPARTASRRRPDRRGTRRGGGADPALRRAPAGHQRSRRPRHHEPDARPDRAGRRSALRRDPARRPGDRRGDQRRTYRPRLLLPCPGPRFGPRLPPARPGTRHRHRPSRRRRSHRSAARPAPYAAAPSPGLPPRPGARPRPFHLPRPAACVRPGARGERRARRRSRRGAHPSPRSLRAYGVRGRPPPAPPPRPAPPGSGGRRHAARGVRHARPGPRVVRGRAPGADGDHRTRRAHRPPRPGRRCGRPSPSTSTSTPPTRRWTMSAPSCASWTIRHEFPCGRVSAGRQGGL
ncbi:hypothetical protein GKQ77_18230 [Streptomyces sp. BG9H]|uniref:Bacterial transcriptional activator domain-containing protein n=1 Tax=Streptomyces anatolicus TaxID=2675858 RepID=A0ABS6YPX6_9ACTN|nr:hypothetical protein [Streptomyces anatolicus]